MSERFDGVIVAGAGPVGLLLALKLARARIPVLVLNDAAGIDASPRAIVYHSPVVEALDRLDLLDDMRRIGVLKQSTEWRSLAGTLLAHVSLSVLHPEDTPFPYNLHLGQADLAAVVLDHLLRLPSAAVRWNHRVVDVTQTDDAITVAVEVAGERRTITSSWLVGADGARSGVRAALGLGFDGITWPEWFVATDVAYDFAAHGYAKATFIVDPVHWAVIVQINESGLFRLTYGEPADLPRDRLRDRLAAKYRAILPGAEAIEPQGFSPYRVHERCADSFRVGRALLAGDAAHVVNPIGGLGLTGGILDAIMLADALEARIGGRVGDAVLDRYAAIRKHIYRTFISPAARENKRRLSETDPDRHAADMARLRLISADKALQREALRFTSNLVGGSVLS